MGSSAGQSPQPAKILTIRTSWLAQSFCRLPHNPPFCCFFLSHLPAEGRLFAINPSFTVMFLQNLCFNPPTRAKRRCAFQPPPPCTLVPEKNNSKLLYITCSYGRSLARGQINREAHNQIMYNSRTKSTLLPRSAARRLSPFQGERQV
jgi:hypothetical protein